MIDDFRNILSLLSDSCVLLITLYTFYLKFWCKKISFIQYYPVYSTFKGNHLSVVIENNTLSPVCLDEVKIIYGNKYKMIMVKYNEPQFIEPFKTFVVKMEAFSYLEGLDFSELNNIRDKYLEISTSKGVIYAKSNRNAKICKGNNNSTKFIGIVREFYNEHLIFPDTKYALLFQTNENLKTIFINKTGFMSETISGFNAIPKEILNDKDKVEEVFKKVFVPLKVPFRIENIAHNYKRQ